MTNHVLFACAESILNAQWSGSRSSWAQKTTAPFVTISRESGSGGTRLARALARLLNAETEDDAAWNIHDGTLVTTMLKENQMTTRLARFLPEDKVSELNASVGELVGLHPSLWDLIQKTNETLTKLARAGRAILVGRGANFATAEIPNGIHVRLVAPAPHRARYLSHLYGLPESEALSYNARRDAGQRRYVASVFGAKVAEHSAYDLVINTSRVSITEAAAQVASLVRARAAAAA